MLGHIDIIERDLPEPGEYRSNIISSRDSLHDTIMTIASYNLLYDGSYAFAALLRGKCVTTCSFPRGERWLPRGFSSQTHIDTLITTGRDGGLFFKMGLPWWAVPFNLWRCKLAVYISFADTANCFVLHLCYCTLCCKLACRKGFVTCSA